MTTGILKIVFTGEDLARIRLATRVDELWEMVLSLHLLQQPGGPPAHRAWRRQARTSLAEAGLLPQVRQTLVPLVPIKAYFPDFLTPYESLSGLSDGLDVIADTAPSRVRWEIDQLRRHLSLPACVEGLARGDKRAIRGLTRLIERYCRTTLAPNRTSMEQAVGHAHARLTRLLTDHGAETMLAGLGPTMRWRPPVLEADYAAGQYEIHLRGRGLTIIPTYFGRITPIALADASLPPVLTIPITHPPQDPGRNDPLPDLLGPTRARVLRCIATAASGCTTSELARRTGVSLPSASTHAQVLQRAGLITSSRHANMVIHRLSPLGSDLIRRRHPAAGAPV
ncbi:ArsR/SmtB family transcription factor [Nonomuraea sp. KM90]|uniref:ArsR/SmtB family transcription factor n=1 Tax=Nonomuraea sp. KM90 TaxID=3457428 RepID=UPI003FCDE5A2